MKAITLAAVSLLLGGCVAVPISENRSIYVPAVPSVTYVVEQPVYHYRPQFIYSPPSSSYWSGTHWHMRYSKNGFFYWSR